MCKQRLGTGTKRSYSYRDFITRVKWLGLHSGFRAVTLSGIMLHSCCSGAIKPRIHWLLPTRKGLWWLAILSWWAHYISPSLSGSVEDSESIRLSNMCVLPSNWYRLADWENVQGWWDVLLTEVFSASDLPTTLSCWSLYLLRSDVNPVKWSVAQPSFMLITNQWCWWEMYLFSVSLNNWFT